MVEAEACAGASAASATEISRVTVRRRAAPAQVLRVCGARLRSHAELAALHAAARRAALLPLGPARFEAALARDLARREALKWALSSLRSNAVEHMLRAHLAQWCGGCNSARRALLE